MVRVLRHVLFSLAIAVPFVAGAVLTGVSRPELVADAVAAPPDLKVDIRPTAVSDVVCDEGVSPHAACRVPVMLGAVGSATATTYDRQAVAGQDYLPLVDVPVAVLDRTESAEVFVDVVDDKECEPPEEFLVVVTGPEVEVVVPVSIVDNDC